MKTRKLVARTLIQKENEQEYLLEYYIIDHLTEDRKLRHGIEIDMDHNNTIQSASVYLPGDESYILGLIELYARNSVMPVSLHDLIEDLSFQSDPVILTRQHTYDKQRA